MMGGQFCCQVKGNHLIGGTGAIRATDRASYRERHPATEGFDVECVPLATTTLNLYGQHKYHGFQRRQIICMGCARRSFPGIPSFYSNTVQLHACFSRQLRDLHANPGSNVCAILSSAARANLAHGTPCGNEPWQSSADYPRPAPPQISLPLRPPQRRRPSAIPR